MKNRISALYRYGLTGNAAKKTISGTFGELRLVWGQLMRKISIDLTFNRTRKAQRVKLDELLTDWENRFLADLRAKPWLDPMTVDDCALRAGPGGALTILGFKPSEQTAKAAKLYVVARDEGLDAATLWKLANW